MVKYLSKTNDYMIGAANTAAVITNPKARHDATIRSLVLSELLWVCENDELPIETVLDKIEAMDRDGLEPTLLWLGCLFGWDSYRDEWHMSAFEQEVYALRTAKESQTPGKPKVTRKKGRK